MLEKFKHKDYRVLFFRFRYIIFAFLLALSISVIVSTIAKDHSLKETVYMAKENIAAGDRISEDKIFETKINKDNKPANALISKNELLEMSAKICISKNEILTTSFCYKNLISTAPYGKVITSIHFINQVNEDVFTVGSYINILSCAENSNESIYLAKKAIILQNKNRGTESYQENNEIIVGVSAKEAEKITRFAKNEQMYAVLIQ